MGLSGFSLHCSTRMMDTLHQPMQSFCNDLWMFLLSYLIGLASRPTCVDARIRVRQSDEVYYNTRHGFRTREEWNRRRVECDKCGMELTAASLNSHLETQHGVFRSRVLNRDFLLNDGEPETYTAYSSTSGSFLCPVPACQEAADCFDTA